MANEFTLPSLGENIKAGDVLHVLIKAGDAVTVDQPVLELETDKATVEVPSSLAGTVAEVKRQGRRSHRRRPGRVHGQRAAAAHRCCARVVGSRHRQPRPRAAVDARTRSARAGEHHPHPAAAGWRVVASR